MKNPKTYTVQFRRKKEGKTDYRKRLKTLLGKKPRLVVRKSLNHIGTQIIKYEPEGDKVLLTAHSRELKKYGWKLNTGNLSAAYLVGLLIGKKAEKKKMEHVVFDIGLNASIKGSRIYALLKGLVDAKMKIACSEEVFPSEDRIKGAHIEKYAALLEKESKDAFQKQFSSYLKQKVNPKEITKNFEDVKNKIISE
ncbi:50S ribosomal protein L18 [Candidatus Woesearchaeota archaeon]|nr:50S ribosomal protein L18 [Candidatus Woesearchaeota archaeon]